jgi:hypothetical protein
VAYADAVGNRRELAHAILTRARMKGTLEQPPRADRDVPVGW